MNSIIDENQDVVVLSSELYKEYHDQEWGTPVYDATLLNFITETFQAGELDYDTQ
jgi:DNA-3-methyladenine glycosylase I